MVGAIRKGATLKMKCAPNQTYSHRGGSGLRKLEAG